MTRPSVYVVMLTHNGSQHLAYSLPSLSRTQYDRWQVLLVDNASTEDVAAVAGRLLPKAQIIRNSENLWWAGGNNVGVRRALEAGAAYVCLVNDDVLLDHRWLEQAVKVGGWCPETGIVGFEMYDSRVPDSRTAFDRAVSNWTELRVEETDNISGAAMVVKREVFEHIGLFDEAYQAYCEENDFESRAMRAGYRMAKTNVPVWHRSGGTFARVPIAQSYLSMRNIVRYGIKNRHPGYALRTAGHVLRVAVSPFVRLSDLDIVDRRYRPRGVLTNMVLALGAIGWNVLHLPGTLAQRRLDRARIEQRSGPCASC